MSIADGTEAGFSSETRSHQNRLAETDRGEALTPEGFGKGRSWKNICVIRSSTLPNSESNMGSGVAQSCNPKPFAKSLWALALISKKPD